MFKYAVVLCTVSAVVALPTNGCADFEEAKEIFKNDLTDAQQAEIKAIFTSALSPTSTLTKAEAKAKLDAFKATLSPEVQAKIAEITPTGLPDIPTNLSADAQAVATQIKNVLVNTSNTVAQDREAIKNIISQANPTVVAELKAAHPQGSCIFPTASP